MNTLIELWWCCLHPAEKGCIQLLLLNYAALVGYTTKQQFDSYWAQYDTSSTQKRVGAFLTYAGLYLDQLEIEEDVFIDIYRYSEPQWSLWLTYLTSEAAWCTGGCKILEFTA